MATKQLDPKEKIRREAARKIEASKNRIQKMKEQIEAEKKSIESYKAQVKK